MIKKFQYNFHPVGQGLFANGILSSNSGNDFVWVYDCGTSFNSSLLEREIYNFSNEIKNKRLNLLILSHFDEDHISGIKLLSKEIQQIETIVVPYLSLFTRLFFISNLKENQTEFAEYLIFPVTFLRKNINEIKKIVFIHTGGNLPENPGISNEEWPPRSNPPIDDSEPELYGAGIYHIDGSIPFVNDDWEFCFYNHPIEIFPSEMQVEADDIYRIFKNSKKDSDDYVNFIYSLKRLFKKELFDKNLVFSSREIITPNEISLVTYVGPVKEEKSYKILPSIYPTGNSLFNQNTNNKYLLLSVLNAENIKRINPSVLFSGDITLNDKIFKEIKIYFGSNRFNKMGFFQVPHHGSEKSFKLKKSYVAKMSHRYSIFSSKKYNKKYNHPSDKVIELLSSHCPVFVNEYQGFEVISV